MAQETYIEKQEESIAIHIFTVSAAMVGVCLTVISIINVISTFKRVATWADELTTLDAIFFLLSCLLSYIALRTKDRKLRLRLEKITDGFFLSGLVIMTLLCIFIVFNFLV